MDGTTIIAISAALTLVGGILGWMSKAFFSTPVQQIEQIRKWMSEIQKRQKSIESDIISLRAKMAEEYVHKADFDKGIDRIYRMVSEVHSRVDDVATILQTHFAQESSRIRRNE